MSKSQSPSKPDIGQIRRDARVILQALLRGDQTVCPRVRQLSPRFAHASDGEILASGNVTDTLEVASREHGFESWHSVQEAGWGHKLLRGGASLEHLKKQAKKLLRAYRAGDEEATERAGMSRGGEFTLNDAQFVLAREYGFNSWPRLVETFEPAAGWTKLSSPQLFTMELLHDAYAPLLAKTLSHHLGDTAMCDTRFIDQTTYLEYIQHVRSLPRTGCLCTFSISTMRSRSVLDVAMPLVFSMLGKGANQDYSLTSDERARMEPVVRDILSDLQSAWETILPTTVGDFAFLADPEIDEAVDPGDTIVLVAFEVNTTQHSEIVFVAYPLPDGVLELRDRLDFNYRPRRFPH